MLVDRDNLWQLPKMVLMQPVWNNSVAFDADIIFDI